MRDETSHRAEQAVSLDDEPERKQVVDHDGNVPAELLDRDPPLQHEQPDERAEGVASRPPLHHRVIVAAGVVAALAKPFAHRRLREAGGP